MTPYEAAKRMREFVREEYKARSRIEQIDKEIETLKAEKEELVQREKDAAKEQDVLLLGLSISSTKAA